MQAVAALGQMDDVLAVEGVIGDHVIDRLAHTQAVGIVDEGSGGAGLAHLLELAAVLPGVRPGTVAGGIRGVMGKRYPSFKARSLNT